MSIRLILEVMLGIYAVVITFLWIMKGSELVSIKLERQEKLKPWDDRVWSKLLFK
jgi:hypothetical protein